jgi:hypothetical protein
VALWLVIDPCVNFGRVYCGFFWYIYFIPQFFWDTRRWIKSKSTIRSIPTHHRQNSTEITKYYSKMNALFPSAINQIICCFECLDLCTWTAWRWFTSFRVQSPRKLTVSRCGHICTKHFPQWAKTLVSSVDFVVWVLKLVTHYAVQKGCLHQPPTSVFFLRCMAAGAWSFLIAFPECQGRDYAQFYFLWPCP